MLRLPATRIGRTAVSSRAIAAASLAGVGAPIPEVVDGQHQPVGQQPVRSEAQRPGEGDAEEIPEEEGRIPERRQAAADVGHHEDEEDDGVRDVAALLVRGQQRTDEEDGGPGRADEGREHRAHAEEAVLTAGRAWMSPVTSTPPEMTNRLASRAMNER